MSKLPKFVPWRPWFVPVLPAAFSLLISLPIENTTVYWQDSGFYLTAVHEFSVLYPHGFVLYLALAKAWSWLLGPIFGFTLSVHLFSAFSVAGASSFAALAARGFLERLWPGGRHDGASVGTACLLASGFTMWHSALLAKTYSLYFLLLSILIWLMVIAERTREFTWMGFVLGLAWAAHPSAALLLPVMVVYAIARRDRLRQLGGLRLAGILGLAAGAAVGPVLFLPWIAARESTYHFASPRTLADLWSYLRGEQYVSGAHSFGVDPGRLVQAGRFFWEEYLGVGLALLAAGLSRMARTRPRLLVLFAAWVLPVAGTAVLFRAEGQLDLWMVALYLPLSLAVAAGIGWRPKAGPVLAAAGVAWSLLANFGDLNQHHYRYAEQFARLLLKNIDPGAPVLLNFDDSIATVSYLQAVQREREEIPIVVRQRLGFPWYDRALGRKTGVRIPDWERSYRSMPGIPPDQLELHAFANENVRPGRPVFSETPPNPRFLRPGLSVTPAGMLWKIAVDSEARLDTRYWDYPADVLALSRDLRRPRGVVFRGLESENAPRPEPFENRLLLRLLQARLALADATLEKDPKAALDQYELVRRAHPGYESDTRFILQWSTALFLSGRGAEAEPLLRALLAQQISVRTRMRIEYYLGEICRSGDRPAEARVHFEEALRQPEGDEALRRRIEQLLKHP